ncbi:MAG: hypothetical protein HC866_14245 [Leptolyngbyaceae cyanobacterium RU_5_1]|nr:hypothetical protein [Leptolyngbyaceae cyanobacterium RU_5_1]
MENDHALSQSLEHLPSIGCCVGYCIYAIAPLTLATSASATPAPQTVAQLFPPAPGQATYAIPAGTRLPVRYNGADKIIVSPTETLPLTLAISRNIRSSYGELLIPANSEVRGRLQPVGDGSQFVAETLVLPNGSRLAIDADSDVVTRRREVQPGVNGDALIKGSVIGAGAATILSGVLGNRRITLGRVLAGAGAGALGGLIFGKKRAEVVVIDPNEDLTLTLNSRLALNPSYSRY